MEGYIDDGAASVWLLVVQESKWTVTEYLQNSVENINVLCCVVKVLISFLIFLFAITILSRKILLYVT